MARTYLTRNGDVLDAIAYRVYGDERQTIALLSANPRIVLQPPELPAGLTLALPDVPKHAGQAQTVRLW